MDSDAARVRRAKEHLALRLVLFGKSDAARVRRAKEHMMGSVRKVSRQLMQLA